MLAYECDIICEIYNLLLAKMEISDFNKNKEIYSLNILLNIKIILFVHRCCHVYAQRIESQLEEFRMEMERMRSRSDAILNMLNMLHSVDTN